MIEITEKKARGRPKKVIEVKPKSNPYSKRWFNAASFGSNEVINQSVSINADIQGGLATIRNRVRALVTNSGYAQGIISTLKNNVIGERGIQINVQGKDSNGSLDTTANSFIEDLFGEWGEYGNCTVEGNMDFVKLQELILSTVAVDGECLVFIRRGSNFGDFNFQLEVLPTDNLDENYYSTLTNGNIIFQGVELNPYFKPVAYHLWQYSLNDPAQRLIGQNKRLRISAEDIIHIYDIKSPKQVRGFSWLVTAILPLHHLQKLNEYELQMARVAILNQVYFKMQKGENWELGEDEIEAAGMINRDLYPAGVEVLPPGVDVQSVDWDSPNNNLNDFKKNILRDISSGIGVSYNTIASDLESVNYSSARFGFLNDKINYSSKQRWFINIFFKRVYQEWLKMQLLTGKVPYGIAKFDKFKKAKYSGRNWQSIDPIKDANASKIQLALGLTTYSEQLNSQGLDFEEVLSEQIREAIAIKNAYQKAGLIPPTPIFYDNKVDNGKQ